MLTGVPRGLSQANICPTELRLENYICMCSGHLHAELPPRGQEQAANNFEVGINKRHGSGFEERRSSSGVTGCRRAPAEVL